MDKAAGKHKRSNHDNNDQSDQVAIHQSDCEDFKFTSNTPKVKRRPKSSQIQTATAARMNTVTSTERAPTNEFVKNNSSSTRKPRKPKSTLSSVSDGDDFNASIPKRRKTTARATPGLTTTTSTKQPRSGGSESEHLRAFNGKQLWTAVEDRALYHVVSERGAQAWDTIAEKLPGRSGKQCRERWFNHVAPCVSKKQWSKEEDKLIMHMVHKHGSKWAFISRFLAGRTDAAVKNRYSTFVRHNLAPKPDSWEQKPRLAVQGDDSDGSPPSPTATSDDPSSCSRHSIPKPAAPKPTQMQTRRCNLNLKSNSSNHIHDVSGSSSAGGRRCVPTQVRSNSSLTADDEPGRGLLVAAAASVGSVVCRQERKRLKCDSLRENPSFGQNDNLNIQSTSYNLTSTWPPITDEPNDVAIPNTKPCVQVPGLGALPKSTGLTQVEIPTHSNSTTTTTTMIQYSNGNSWDGHSLQRQSQHQQQLELERESQPQNCFPWQAFEFSIGEIYNGNLCSQQVEQQHQQQQIYESHPMQWKTETIQTKLHPQTNHVNLPSSIAFKHSHGRDHCNSLELQIEQFAIQHPESDETLPTNLLLLLARVAALEEPTQFSTGPPCNKVRLPSFTEQFGSI